MKPRMIDYSLMLVTDHCSDADVFCAIVEQALQAGVMVLQLREKTAATRDFYQLALRIKSIARQYDVPLLINDRLDIALAVDADGVHVGQEDLPVAVVRRLIGPDKILGATAATVAQALRAETEGADYIGSGAMFPTLTKPGKPVLPMSVLAQIKQAVKVPVVAIGGITADNLLMLKNAGVDGVAVVSAIMDSAEPAAATQEILSRWCK